MKKVNPIPNSKPFEKGQSGNPNGRPKKLPALDEIGAALLSEEKSGINALEAILKGMISKAVKGDTQAAKLILERFYGQSKQVVEHSGNIGTNIDPSKLSIKELELLVELSEKAKRE